MDKVNLKKQMLIITVLWQDAMSGSYIKILYATVHGPSQPSLYDLHWTLIAWCFGVCSVYWIFHWFGGSITVYSLNLDWDMTIHVKVSSILFCYVAGTFGTQCTCCTSHWSKSAYVVCVLFFCCIEMKWKLYHNGTDWQQAGPFGVCPASIFHCHTDGH